MDKDELRVWQKPKSLRVDAAMKLVDAAVLDQICERRMASQIGAKWYQSVASNYAKAPPVGHRQGENFIASDWCRLKKKQMRRTFWFRRLVISERQAHARSCWIRPLLKEAGELTG